MFYVLLALIALGVWLFCLFDVLTTDEAAVRYLPKFGWFLIVLLGFWIGALVWMGFGRPRQPAAQVWSGTTSPDPEQRELPRGPDDDPEFLRNLERRIRGDE
ncbi:PLDc N-terminal domain-containing protein [Actinomadura sp. HBU206391]|uniref:PLDc N-terminal domain-containing protein n=1 Tax=Actinomadura sp. HBU206391 TaxID=2731692 RepID=UPI0016508B04|nr:PLDc N-terminal domain-containing protein [Actinomadura sp. HBU206391]MBC6457688.1 PLDc N-terminal domain-containing protein [Actinomadura sp. HBU206391]